jgi:hypothetical protein
VCVTVAGNQVVGIACVNGPYTGDIPGSKEVPDNTEAVVFFILIWKEERLPVNVVPTAVTLNEIVLIG